MVPDVDSNSSSQTNDGGLNNIEMDLFNSYSSSERTLLDAYELTFNKKTKEATIMQLRTALVHYNITNYAYDIQLCYECVVPSLGLWRPKNSIAVHIEITNNYYDEPDRYYGYDLRAIFVQEDTDGEEDSIYDSFEIVSPECDSIDIWCPGDDTDPDPDPDDLTLLDPTNPFFPLYYVGYCALDDTWYTEDQRILPPTMSAEDIDFTLALNFNDAPDIAEDFMHALIMIDVSYLPDYKYDIPNCHEPYRITFSEEDGMYPHIVAGNEHTVNIRIYDHACDQEEDNNYQEDIDGDVFFYASNPLGGDLEDISADFGSPTVDPYPGGDTSPGQGYSFIIEPDEDLDAGIYEGVIVITDAEANPNHELKRKIWVTVEQHPEVIDDEEITDVLYGVSGPVRADLNDDSYMDTIFTTDYWLWGIGLGWYDPECVDVTESETAGCFVGVPTIADVDDDVDDVLLSFKGDAAIDDCIYAIDGSTGEVMWSTPLITRPVSHPIAILDGSGDVEFIFLVCEGGKVFGQDRPAMRLFDTDGDAVDGKQGPGIEFPRRYGPPAILERDSTTYAFVMRDDFSLTFPHPLLEAWDVGNLDDGDINAEYAAGISTTGPHSPTIGYVDDGQNTHDLIYAPSTNALTLLEWEDPNFSYVAATTLLGEIPYDGRVVLGDMNRDGYQDVVVGYVGGVAVYTGYVPSDPYNMSFRQIWNYDTANGFTASYAPPVLIDCNGDSYLDVITGISVTGIPPPDHRLLVLDGSPYNNNNRTDAADRIILTWDPGTYDLMVYGQSPALSETDDGTIEIAALFIDDSEDEVLYQLVDTLFGFHHPDYDDYQREPWLKAFYSLSNWNNPQEDGPDY